MSLKSTLVRFRDLPFEVRNHFAMSNQSHDRLLGFHAAASSACVTLVPGGSAVQTSRTLFPNCIFSFFPCVCHLQKPISPPARSTALCATSMAVLLVCIARDSYCREALDFVKVQVRSEGCAGHAYAVPHRTHGVGLARQHHAHHFQFVSSRHLGNLVVTGELQSFWFPFVTQDACSISSCPLQMARVYRCRSALYHLR